MQQQGDEGDLWHRTLINPTLLRVLGPLEGQHVLDLACGNGYIERKLAKVGHGLRAWTPPPPPCYIAP
jgi:hypothetical protein